MVVSTITDAIYSEITIDRTLYLALCIIEPS